MCNLGVVELDFLRILLSEFDALGVQFPNTCVLRHAKGRCHTYNWCGAGDESSKEFTRQMTENVVLFFIMLFKVWLCQLLVLGWVGLRGFLAVTWLTVYRQLQVPTQLRLPTAAPGKHVWQNDL